MMKKQSFVIASILIIVLSAFTAFQIIAWKVGPDYTVKFKVDDIEGTFGGLKGTINFDPNNLKSSKFDVSIDVNTINTGNTLMSKKALSSIWLDAKKYPLIKFTSKTITKDGAGFIAKGTLEMHGVKKEIALPFTFTNTSKGNSFIGNLEVNRRDYGIGDEDLNLGAIIRIVLQIPVVK